MEYRDAYCGGVAGSGIFIFQDKMRRLVYAAFLAALIFSAGCSGLSSDKAPNIRYGKDPCAECRMIIGDERFAAAFVNEDGEGYKT